MTSFGKGGNLCATPLGSDPPPRPVIQNGRAAPRLEEPPFGNRRISWLFYGLAPDPRPLEGSGLLLLRLLRVRAKSVTKLLREKVNTIIARLRRESRGPAPVNAGISFAFRWLTSFSTAILPLETACPKATSPEVPAMGPLRSLFQVFFFTALIVSCGGEKGPAGPGQDDPGGGGGGSRTVTVGAGGGTVKLADGTAVVIPPGAVTGSVPVTLAREPALGWVGGSSEGVVVSTTAPQEQFAKKVEIRVPLPVPYYGQGSSP